MNPFTEPTVALPLTEPPCFASNGCVVRPSGPILIKRRKQRRSLFSSTLRAMGLATSLGLTSSAAHAIDVNAATLEQLQSVRGIGSKTAGIILEERNRGGRFESFDDLSERVKGIGPKKAASLQASGLTLGAGGREASGAASAATTPSGQKPALIHAGR